MSRRGTIRIRALHIACMVLLVAILAALMFPVFFRAREKARQAPSPPSPGVMAAEPSMGDEALASDKAAVSTSQPSAAAGRKLVYTADLSVEVDDTRAAIEKATAAATKAAGFVGGSTLSRYDDGSLHGSVTVRVPSDEFSAVLDQFKSLGRMDQLSSNVEDVTGQFVDLDARLRNRKREEEVLLKLFERNAKLQDVIQVEARLSEVRESIEVLEGQMRTLKEQIALSTITLNLYEKGEAAVAETESYALAYHLRSAGRSLVVVLQGLATFLIYVIVVGWVFWLPLVLIIWWVRRRRRARQTEE